MDNEIINKIQELDSRVTNIEDIENRYKFSDRDATFRYADFRGRFKIPNVSSTPSVCEQGQLCSVSGTVYICSATNTWTEIASKPITQLTMTSPAAGETITGIKPVSISTESTSTQTQTTITGSETLSTTQWFAQKFTSPAAPLVGIKTVRYYITQDGSTNYTVDIRTDNGGVPSATSLGTVQVAVTGATSDQATDFTFSSVISLSASTVYHAIIKPDSAAQNPKVSRNNTGTGQGTSKTTDSGSNWADNTGPLAYVFTFQTIAPGLLYRTDASSSDFYANGFIGFTTATISSGSTGTVVIGGVVTGLSGLTVGAQYYLSDTTGEISTSAGSQSRKIGNALTTTTLLLKFDNA